MGQMREVNREMGAREFGKKSPAGVMIDPGERIVFLRVSDDGNNSIFVRQADKALRDPYIVSKKSLEECSTEVLLS
jgi:hypothetical protein